MKKTLFAMALGCAFCASSWADTTTFDNLTSDITINDISFALRDDGTGTFTGGTLYAPITGNQAATSVSFILDLTAAQAITAEHKAIVTLNYAGSDIGLTAGTAGAGALAGTNLAWSDPNGTVTWDAFLASLTDTYTVDGHTYAALTLRGANVPADGLVLFNTQGQEVLRYSGLGSSGSNRVLNGITVDTSVISAVAITPEKLDAAAAGAAATVLQQQVVPEPATATLSLLALAGLAARRRRSLRAF